MGLVQSKERKEQGNLQDRREKADLALDLELTAEKEKQQRNLCAESTRWSAATNNVIFIFRNWRKFIYWSNQDRKEKKDTGIDQKEFYFSEIRVVRLFFRADVIGMVKLKIVGGDHRLKNYSSIITVHPEITDGRPGTLVIESFVVDVPDGNTNDETCYFVKALINCNFKSLADVSERMAIRGGPTVRV
ncbi:hypothetical protein Vadar_011590 [Vaccinium darrowii]|uniref:Uncharacterized protein n=1 Tax=Vaccinium darrowii TaxID=229202 RepID=A0ACB7Y635_9ERIC|nr:hypothetical protein Vadar_011590 [Vaccinium darrowii]